MPRPTVRGARWHRMAVRGIVLAAAILMVAGCSGPSNARPTGNAMATLPDETIGPPQSGAPVGPTAGGGAAGASVAQNGLIPPNELAGVYQQIVERYVGPVDHAQLVESAVAAVQQAAQQAHVLPPDRAMIDLVPQPTGNPEEDWGAFARAYNQMVGKYPQWAAQARPDRAVIQSMLATLQDETVQLIEPSDLVVSGDRISGIGVSMTKPGDGDPPHVTEVYPNGPAATAGLRPGDQIVAINGTPTDTLTLAQASSLTGGQEGTPVTLSVSRGDQQQVAVRLTRANVNIQPIDFAVRPDGYAIMRVRRFTEQAPELVQRLLVVGQNQGIRGWVVDLRGNTGGTPQAMAMIATNFVGPRPVAFALDRDDQRSALQAPNRPAIGQFPFALVVDRATTSWGEVMAASVKEYQTGPVIGTRTAGSVGLITLPLSDGSAVQLNVARVQTPGGVPIDKSGVEPDITVDVTAADLQNGDDPPIRRAIELLQSSPSQIVR